jgi:hypothetical protein
MASVAWNLRGDYFENCNCEVLCPCIHNPIAEPTEGHCDVALAFHVEEGYFDDTALDGLNFVVVLNTPTVMGEGNWKTALYLDQRANPQQRTALEQILSGKLGGPAERWMGLTGKFLGTKYVPIAYVIDGKRRRVTIPRIIDFNVEGIQGRGRDDVLTLTNTAHPVNSSLALARGTQSSYTDHDMRWDNTDRNAHYSEFNWRWPSQ